MTNAGIEGEIIED